MNTDSHTATDLREGLLDAQSRAENGDYKLALDSVRTVKSTNPRNVYVLAFEKQLEQLYQLFSANLLSEEQKLDIIESLPGIVERAMDGQGAELSTGQTAVFKPLSEETLRQKEEKSAALEWLKNQYFQHAHDYVRKGEYEHALAEIRRVFIIEPANQIAQDFEAQIRQLSQLKRTRQTEPPPPAAAKPPAPAPVPPPPAPRPRHVVDPPGPVEAAPAVAKDDAPARPAPEAAKPKPRMSNWVVLAILLTIAVIGYAAFYFIIRPHRVERIKFPGTVAPTSDAIFSPPTATEERTFVISSNPAEQISATNTPPGEQLDQASTQRQREEQSAQEMRGEPAVRRQEPLAKSGGPDASPAGAGTPQSSPASAQETSSPPATQEETSSEPFIVVEQPPQIIRLEKPRFSDGAYKLGLEGQVVVQVQIDAEGRPLQAKVLTSSNPLLEEGVLDAVLRSQFTAGRMSSGPVASSMVIPFRFRR